MSNLSYLNMMTAQMAAWRRTATYKLYPADLLQGWAGLQIAGPIGLDLRRNLLGGLGPVQSIGLQGCIFSPVAQMRNFALQ